LASHSPQAMNDSYEFVRVEPLSPCKVQQLLGSENYCTALGCAGDHDAPSASKLEKTFLTQVSERSKHRVLVDFRNRCEVTCGRKALPRLRLTLGNGTSQVGRHSQIQGYGLTLVRCHGQMILRALVSFHDVGLGVNYHRGAARNDDSRSPMGRRSDHRAGEAATPPAPAWCFGRCCRPPWSDRIRNGNHAGRLTPSVKREDREHPSTAAPSGTLLVLGGPTRSEAHFDGQYPTSTSRSAPDDHERECIAL
jgi:hypothetical protein